MGEHKERRRAGGESNLKKKTKFGKKGLEKENLGMIQRRM